MIVYFNKTFLASLSVATSLLVGGSAPATATTVLDQLMGSPQTALIEASAPKTVAPIEYNEQGYPLTARGYWLAPIEESAQGEQDYAPVVDIESAMQTDRTIDFTKLPFDLAITRTKGDGSRLLAVIVDPSCPHCRMLEEEIAKLDNVMVFTFVASILGRSQELVNEIQCAGDASHTHRALAYDYFSMNQSHLFQNTDQACVQAPGISDKIKESIQGYKGIDMKTPTIIFPSNVFVSSAMTKDQIEEILNLDDGSGIIEKALAFAPTPD